MPMRSGDIKGLTMHVNDETEVDVLLDASPGRRVAAPLLPEFAIVSTLVLIAAPVVLVGITAVVALTKRLRGATDEGAGELTPGVRWH